MAASLHNNASISVATLGVRGEYTGEGYDSLCEHDANKRIMIDVPVPHCRIKIIYKLVPTDSCVEIRELISIYESAIKAYKDQDALNAIRAYKLSHPEKDPVTGNIIKAKDFSDPKEELASHHPLEIEKFFKGLNFTRQIFECNFSFSVNGRNFEASYEKKYVEKHVS